MHTIRQDQYDSWLQSDPEQFVELVFRHIAETIPEEIRGIPLHLVRAMIGVAIKRARKYRLTGDAQIMGFVAVMFEIAPNFDEEPTLRAILMDTRGEPEERWETLFTDSPELNAAWERAAHPDFYNHTAWIDIEPNDQRDK